MRHLLMALDSAIAGAVGALAVFLIVGVYLWAKEKKRPVMRSTENGDILTRDELEFIRRECLCPDCGGGLLQGPCGGVSMNVKCDDCGSKFNLLGMGELGAERISDPGVRPGKLGVAPKLPTPPKGEGPYR